MNKLTAVLGLVALLGNVVTAGQHDWENAEVIQINTEKPHATLAAYNTLETAK